ncbi:MAG: DUF3006 domain-containing protein [Gemmatimonadetes bacterium]|nr:DUF3006 domain-containing protein [Gemmatimonadota bacterium]MXX73435.1 DUF3006 domain-containing protein [Gemmatimonadota bacterium]MYC92210.1 DUF3006 domain-containing protein [Gemmatimonadota bacterium]MYG35803.1 DUF3006 domain-containing protein [Gemmatimonadota bacterium]
MEQQRRYGDTARRNGRDGGRVPVLRRRYVDRDPGSRRPESVWVVDRVEGAVAVLVRDEDAHHEDVPVTLLPAGVGEGAVLRVPEFGDSPAWAHATVDEELRMARLREAEEVLDRLRRRDPGGDVVL